MFVAHTPTRIRFHEDIRDSLTAKQSQKRHYETHFRPFSPSLSLSLCTPLSVFLFSPSLFLPRPITLLSHTLTTYVGNAYSVSFSKFLRFHHRRRCRRVLILQTAILSSALHPSILMNIKSSSFSTSSHVALS